MPNSATDGVPYPSLLLCLTSNLAKSIKELPCLHIALKTLYEPATGA
jgi:hypothetical protein